MELTEDWEEKMIRANEYDCMGNLCGIKSDRFLDGTHWFTRDIYKPKNKQWYDCKTRKHGDLIFVDGESPVFIVAVN